MTWTHSAFETLTRLVRTRTGLTFTLERRPGVELGIRRAMARAGVAELDRYRDLVARDGTLMDDLIGELTVPETYFFREPAQFEFLRKVALPEIAGRRGPGHTIRAWSAGCCSGEEAYSLAMLFAEEGLEDRSHVLATDVSRVSLAKARQARYGEWSLRGEGAATARRHLRCTDGRYAVDGAILDAVTLEHLNLALDVYPSYATGAWGMDLILCRNVLIYFDRETTHEVALRLHATLAEGGWLVTASSDPPLPGAVPLEVVAVDEGVFYRRKVAHSLSEPRSDDSRDRAPPQPDARPGSVGFERTSAASGGDAEPREAVGGPPVPSNVEGVTVLEAAREDLARGDYSRAAERAGSIAGVPEADALYVRALANLDPPGAERACATASDRNPLSGELHYLHAVLLLGLGRDAEAARAVRRALYLDRSLAIAHFVLGSIQRRRGDLAGARRSFRNVRELCAACPVDEVVPLSDGDSAGRLAESARLQLTWLDALAESRT